MTAIRFNEFELDTSVRRLAYRGTDVPLRSRAFDILSILAANAGQPVSKAEIISFVWPSVYVDDGALRVHINGLRNALRAFDARELVTTIAGRGYCLAAQTEVSSIYNGARQDPIDRLPWPAFSLVGREDIIERWTSEASVRACTIVGDRGIGKSAVAIEMARKLLHTEFETALFVDLSCVASKDVVASIAAVAAVPNEAADLDHLSRSLGDSKTLLLLDGCDSARGEVKRVVDHLLAWTPTLSVLATSREMLGIRGERVKVLHGLATPLPGGHRSPVTYPSVALFLSVAMDVNRIQDDDPATLSLVAGIVSELGGSPVEIEVAARLTRTHSLDEILTQVRGRRPGERDREEDASLQPKSYHRDSIRTSVSPERAVQTLGGGLPHSVWFSEIGKSLLTWGPDLLRSGASSAALAASNPSQIQTEPIRRGGIPAAQRTGRFTDKSLSIPEAFLIHAS